MKKTDKEQEVLDNKKEIVKDRITSAKENLIEKMKVKNLNENPLDTFIKMKNFRKEKVSFGKVSKKLLSILF